MKALSDYWAQEELRGGGADQAARLALVLRAVQATVRVIDTTVPPLTVEWATAEGHAHTKPTQLTSYTDLRRNRMVINPGPVLAGNLSMAEEIDICGGFGMHEASHSMYSRAPYETLLVRDEKGKEHPAVTPLRVASTLLNIVEDVRIEGLTGTAYPGTRAYFTKALGWMWDTHRDIWPKRYGPKLSDKLQAVIGICKWPTEVATIFTHKSFAPEVPWWTAWQDDYLAGRVDAKTTIERGIEHLGCKDEMDKMREEEEAAEKAGESIRRLLDRLEKEGVKGTVMICLNERGEAEVLSGDAADQVNKLVREGLIEHKTVITAQGAANVPLHISRPEETPQSRRSYVGRPDATVQQMKNALVFRQGAPEYDVKLLETGRLDEEELWRYGPPWASASERDYRVFSDHLTETKPNAELSLLVDLSGSMYGTNLENAQRLAQQFVWAVAEMRTVKTKVFGHTGDNEGTWVDLYRIWEPGDPLSRLGLISTLPHSNNYDGHAIAWCVKELMERGEANDQRVLIVLSDGLPHGSGYGNAAAMKHMRQVCLWAQRAGVSVLQIALTSDLKPNEQEAMYGPSRWIGYQSDEQLPRDLSRLLSSVV
jgi:hypothetical protein